MGLAKVLRMRAVSFPIRFAFIAGATGAGAVLACGSSATTSTSQADASTSESHISNVAPTCAKQDHFTPYDDEVRGCYGSPDGVATMVCESGDDVCKPACDAPHSNYVVCAVPFKEVYDGGRPPQPDPSLGCHGIAIPTTENTSVYCCECVP